MINYFKLIYLGGWEKSMMAYASCGTPLTQKRIFNFIELKKKKNKQYLVTKVYQKRKLNTLNYLF